MRETYMSEPFEFSFPTCTLDVIQNEAFNVSISGTLGDIKSRVDFRVSPCPEGITWEKVFPEHLPPSIRFLGFPSTIGTSTVHIAATTATRLSGLPIHVGTKSRVTFNVMPMPPSPVVVQSKSPVLNMLLPSIQPNIGV